MTQSNGIERADRNTGLSSMHKRHNVKLNTSPDAEPHRPYERRLTSLTPTILALTTVLSVPVSIFIIASIEISVDNWREKAQQKKQQRHIEDIQRDRIARPDYWAEIDARREAEQKRLEQEEIEYHKQALTRLLPNSVSLNGMSFPLTKTPDATPAETYMQAKDRLDAVQLRYANAHFHRGQEARFIFDAPAVFDVTVPATATYLDAVAEAEARFISIENFDAVADADAVDAVDAAEFAWDEMVDFAQRNIVSAMDHATRARVTRLVNLVAHSGTDDAEAALARDRLVGILSEITYTVPLIGGGVREIQLNPHTMFNPRQMRDMAALEHANYPQLER